MENEITIFFQNVKLLGPEILDLDGLVKQYRVPVNSQMFQKSNHKGMALLIKPLLCFFDETYEGTFETSWFPFGLAQMKPFKDTCLFIATDLVEKGRIPNNLISKSIIENAVGIKIWHAFRRLSDIIVEDRIRQMEDNYQVGGNFSVVPTDEMEPQKLRLMGRALKVNIQQ